MSRFQSWNFSVWGRTKSNTWTLSVSIYRSFVIYIWCITWYKNWVIQNILYSTATRQRTLENSRLVFLCLGTHGNAVINYLGFPLLQCFGTLTPVLWSCPGMGPRSISWTLKPWYVICRGVWEGNQSYALVGNIHNVAIFRGISHPILNESTGQLMFYGNSDSWETSQIAKFMEPTWGPSGSWRPKMSPMLAKWTLLSGIWRRTYFSFQSALSLLMH